MATRICVLASALDNSSVCFELAAKDRVDYCAIHGYQYAVHDMRSCDSFSIRGQEKLTAMLKHLSSCDWLFWTDMDRCIMNFAFKLELLLDDSSEIILSRERDAVDSGSLLLKNTTAVREFLENARVEWETTSAESSGVILRKLLRRAKLPKIRYVPQSTFSSDFKTYTRGDFMLRLADDNDLHKFSQSIFAETSLSIDEKEQFAHVFNSLGLCRAGAVIGVGRGEFADGMVGRWKGSRLYLVDAWKTSPERPLKRYLGDEILELDWNHVNQWFSTDSRVKIIRETAMRAAAAFGEQSLDWVFFDETHSRDLTSEDLCAWLPKLRRGGIVAGRARANWTQLGFSAYDSISGKIASSRGAKLRLTAEQTGPCWYFIKNWE